MPCHRLNGNGMGTRDLIWGNRSMPCAI
ncbi:hypothetical protein RAA17_01170 [Komagataeibacter rhaeticus]|nr:hypothetical protein [Komagataeibacter rhaeticus]